jgi:AraC-like DNA-binding protein
MQYIEAHIKKPLKFLSAGIFESNKSWVHSERIIDNFEIIIVVKGIVYIQQNEEKYELHEGDMLLLRPECLHKGYAPSARGTSFYWLHFISEDKISVIEEIQAVDRLLTLAKNDPYFTGLADKVLLPTKFHVTNMERLSILFHQLLHISESHYYTGLGSNYSLTSLILELTEQVLGSSADTATRSSEKLSKITEWIRVHLSKRISLKNVAYEFNYSREYLSRFFKKNMGMGVQEYINKMRIAKARELLVESDKNILEIASELGFADDKYFLKLFKRYEKITPGEYRRAYHKLHINNI